VILLIEAGEKRLLFPDEAQIENWTWALKPAPPTPPRSASNSSASTCTRSATTAAATPPLVKL
jgi:hypothetical protein